MNRLFGGERQQWLHGLKRIGSEAMGVGTNLRLSMVIFWKMQSVIPDPQGKAPAAGICLRRFLDSAERITRRFGPFWSKRDLRGRCLGAWVLLGAWIIPPGILIANCARGWIRRNSVMPAASNAPKMATEGHQQDPHSD